MNKNTAYSFLIAAVFVVSSMTAYNINHVDKNDPQLLNELIDLEEVSAAKDAPVVAVKKTKSIDKLLRQCATCHTFTQNGKNKTGPNLFAIYQKKIAQNDNFKYSNSFKSANIVWDEASLDAFLTKPKDFVPKTKMAFNGLKNAEERAKVVSYLKELN